MGGIVERVDPMSVEQWIRTHVDPAGGIEVAHHSVHDLSEHGRRHRVFLRQSGDFALQFIGMRKASEQSLFPCGKLRAPLLHRRVFQIGPVHRVPDHVWPLEDGAPRKDWCGYVPFIY